MNRRATAYCLPIRLGVCVDDFGLNPRVNAAALRLAEAGRISAISCLVDAPAWRSGAAELGSVARRRIDIGLHLNLTEAFGPALPRLALPALIVRAYAAMLDARAVSEAIRAQFDAFEDMLGIAPDFVDGHQHVHTLPGIRAALVAELGRRYPDRRAWLRRTRPARSPRLAAMVDADHFKQRVIAALGDSRLAHLAHSRGLRQNHRLLGVYGFTGSSRDYTARLARWCQQAEDNDLLMCHPADGEDRSDQHADARWKEYTVLRGDSFAQALATRGIAVTRLSSSLGAIVPPH